MFAFSRSTISRINTRFYHECKRLYSASHGSQQKKAKFDKSVLRPAFLIVIFGSLLTNVADIQRKTNEIERKYEVRIHKLQELIERIKNNERGIDIDQELKLVNLLFYERDATEAAKLVDHSKERYGEKHVLASMNELSEKREKLRQKNQSLDDIWRDIVEEIKDESTNKPPSNSMQRPSPQSHKKVDDKKTPPGYL